MQVLQTLAGTVGVLTTVHISYRVPDLERAQFFETVNWASVTYERGQIFEAVNWT